MQISQMGSCFQRLSFLAVDPTISIPHLAAALQQLTLLQSFTLQFTAEPGSGAADPLGADLNCTTRSGGTDGAASAGPQARAI